MILKQANSPPLLSRVGRVRRGAEPEARRLRLTFTTSLSVSPTLIFFGPKISARFFLRKNLQEGFTRPRWPGRTDSAEKCAVNRRSCGARAYACPSQIQPD